MRTTEMDPNRIHPTEGRCVVKRFKAEGMRGKIFLPRSKDNSYTFEGEVVSINERPQGDAVYVHAGDRVWFSAHVGPDDSNFFTWDDEDFVLIPCDAIQAVAA